MLNMRGCFATLSGGGEARRGSVVLTQTREMLPAAAWREECGAAEISTVFWGAADEGRWGQESVKHPPAKPWRLLASLMLNVDWLSIVPAKYYPGHSRALLQRRKGGQVCLWQLWRVLWCKQGAESPCLQVDRWWCGEDGHYECQSSVMSNEDRSLDTVISEM